MAMTGSTPATTSVMPTGSTTARAAAALSPVNLDLSLPIAGLGRVVARA